MKIIYSPHFDGNTYVDYNKHGEILFDTELVGDSGLLERFETILGHYCPDDEERRAKDYYLALKEGLDEGWSIYESFKNDRNDEEDPFLPVTKEILKWRDTLMMCGWDCKKQIPGLKFEVIAAAEQHIGADSAVRWGMADRWLQVLAEMERLKAENLEIEVHIPRILVKPVILKVLDGLNAEWKIDKGEPELSESTNYTVENFQQLNDAYEWMATREPVEGQVVVCKDPEKLDFALMALGKPKAGDAQVGCHQVIHSIQSMLDRPTDILWLDCNGDYGLDYPLTFLSEQETEALNAALEVPVAAEKDMLDAVKRHIFACLKDATNVTLVSSKYEGTDILTEHPIRSMVNQILGEQEEKSEEEDQVIGGTPIDKFDQKFVLNLGKDLVQREDEKMSSSTLEVLMQSPFDYVVQRQARLREPEEVQPVAVLEGTVAHKIVELMVNEYKKLDINFYEECLEKALQEREVEELTKEEHHWELENFKQVARESIEVLIKIIKDNGLTPVEAEMPIPTDAHDKESEGLNIEGLGPCKAFIDLVLEDKEGKPVIFDFKYSRRQDFPDKMAQGKSVQFEMYTHLYEALKGTPVKSYGYYMFPLQKLYVPQGSFIKGEHVEEVPLEQDAITDLWERLKRSYDFRMDQLHKGEIEQAEGMDATKLAYYNDPSLFPLKVKEPKKGDVIKDEGYGKNIVLKDKIK